MNRSWTTVLTLAAVLALPALGWAHAGHAHKVMGTISAMSATQIDVKTTDGKMVAVAVNAKTVYKHGKAKADAKMLKVGDRVVIDAVQEEGAKLATAQTVQMAAEPTAAKTSAAKTSAAPSAPHGH